VLDKADEFGMAVILGLFYFGQDERLKGEEAVQRGVDGALDWLADKGYRNVLIEINNECDARYDHDLLKPGRVHAMIERARRHRGGFLAGTGYGGGRIPGDTVIRASDFSSCTETASRRRSGSPRWSGSSGGRPRIDRCRSSSTKTIISTLPSRRTIFSRRSGSTLRGATCTFG
jgi:hypothetical protein